MRKILILILLLCSYVVPLHATDYYFNTSTGSDGAAGTSSAPWKTCDRANSVNLNAGDRLRFQGGQNFDCDPGLLFDSSDLGTEASPIVIHSWNGSKATLNSGNGLCVYIENTAGIKIDGIICAGSGVSTNTTDGLNAWNNQNGTKETYLYVMNSEFTGYGANGVSIGGNTDGFSKITLRNSKFYGNKNNGAHIYGPQTNGSYANDTVMVENCDFYDNLGDTAIDDTSTGSGLIVSDVNGGTVVDSRAYNNGENNTYSAGPVGIWTYHSNNLIFTGNVSHDNNTSGGDGGGFDFDGGVSNSIMEYNFSYNNHGAGYLIAQYVGAPNLEDNKIRYNVSINDAQKAQACILLFNAESATDVDNNEIYNNTCYVGAAITGSPSAFRAFSATSNTVVKNNIFRTTGSYPVVTIDTNQTNMVWANNLRYTSSGGTTWANVSPSGDVTTDPLFVNPGTTTAADYKLQYVSGARNTGATITGAPSTDFFSVTVPQQSFTDIGFSEIPNDTTAPPVPNQPTLVSKTSTTVDIAWSAVTDTGSGVAEYRVYRWQPGGTIASGLTTLTYHDAGPLSPNTLYKYYVKAVDHAGNQSAWSAYLEVTTNP